MPLAAIASRPTAASGPDPEPQPDASLAARELSALVRRAQGGDVRAFQHLVAQHQRKVLSFALSFTADADEAADLSQEALVKVYRSLASFRFQSSFSTWLFRIVKNTFLDAMKSRAANERRRQTSIDDVSDAVSETALAEEGLLRAEDKKALYTALGQVPETYRMVIVLFDVDGFAYDEIAAILAIPIGTVKSRLKRGRDALREELCRTRSDDRQRPRLKEARPS